MFTEKSGATLIAETTREPERDGYARVKYCAASYRADTRINRAGMKTRCRACRDEFRIFTASLLEADEPRPENGISIGHGYECYRRRDG